MTASHQNTHRAFLSYEDAQKWNDFMPLYFLWRGNGTEPIFNSLLLKGSSQSQLSCCGHSGWTEATSAAQVPLGLKPQDHSASLCIERARCLSLQRSAHNNTSSGSGGELAFLFWPLFLIQVWSGVGRRKKSSFPHLFKKIICTRGTTTLCSKYSLWVNYIEPLRVHGLELGVVVMVLSSTEGSSPNPQDVQRCMEQEEPVRFLYVHTHTWRVTSPLINTKMLQLNIFSP